MYNGLKLLFPKSSEKLFLAFSLIATNAIIYAHETGLFSRKEPDYWDIPAGVIGSILYAGANYLSKRFSESKTGREFIKDFGL